MTLDKLPGFYFVDEVVNVLSDDVDDDEVLTFIVQTNSAIESIDDKLTFFDNYNAFRNIAAGKGLINTLKVIETILANTGHTGFYVYSVKTNTVDGWKESVESAIHLKQNRKYIFFEEKTDSLSLSNKIAAINTACNNCYEYGAFKTSYIVPYATIEDAITNAESGTIEETAISTFTTLLSGEGSGRITILLPDAAAQMMATIINAGYDTEPGYPVISGSIASLRFNFTYPQMITLMNLGVCFVRQERINGTYQYRINLGVTTSFKESKADGLIVDRLIADELLHRIDEDNSGNIKNLEGESSITFVQAGVDNVISEFVDNKLVTKEGTKLTVYDAGNMKYAVNGTIQTVKTLAIIEVSAVIS